MNNPKGSAQAVSELLGLTAAECALMQEWFPSEYQYDNKLMTRMALRLISARQSVDVLSRIQSTKG